MTEDAASWQTWSIVMLATCTAVLAVVCLLLLARLKRMKREREAIEREERRMFDFLHGLGGKMQASGSPSAMHKEVVAGVVRVVGARGGILYLHDVRKN
jgi:hypothetical protein